MPLPGKAPGALDISDLPGQTILIAEAAKPVNWTAPEDLPFVYSPEGYPPTNLGGHFGPVFHVIMADGTPLQVKQSIKPLTLQGAITPAGRETLGPDWEAAVPTV